MAQPNPQPVANSSNTIWIYLSYVLGWTFLGWIFGLIGLAVVKDDENVRFHCAQGLVFSAAVCILNIILTATVILSFLTFLVGIAALVYGILVALKAAKGEHYKIPFCGDFAEKNLMNLFK